MENLIEFLQREQEKYVKIDGLARSVLKLSRNTLLVNLRFLDMALSQFELIPVDQQWATDGHYILYDPRRILRLYQVEKELPVRDYMHMVMHCVYRHMFINTLVNQQLWNLACDIAVEVSITELNLKAAQAKREELQKADIEKLSKNVGMLTAEKLYRYFLDHRPSEKELMRLSSLFKGDDHELWYMTDVAVQEKSLTVTDSETGESKEVTYGELVKTQPQQGDGDDAQEGDGDDAQEGEGHRSGQKDSVGQGNQKDGSGNVSSMFGDALEKIWKDISERMQTDMETFSNGRFGGAGSLTQNLKSVNREKYDYTEFLKKFAVMGEAMKINDDEFDYIFYTYGLQLYKNVPLIEPLEYKEIKRIKDFVIAIDTSGSVVGSLVQQFVQKTYNVLKSTESFFSKINLHIIQCDDIIQEDVTIHSQEEFDRYMKTMQLHGFGGNNEVRLFQYVDELVKNKQFTNLKGMIYFTDGYGIFPKDKPDYDVAFVFINDRYEIPEVPSWVIRLVLQKEEI